LIQAFRALEYTSKNDFIGSEYRFTGSIDAGWTVTRNGRAHMKLGPGYRLLQTMYCGICSTDLARRFLPFPLPQIIGHETVARDLETGSDYVIEINDTCLKHPSCLRVKKFTSNQQTGRSSMASSTLLSSWLMNSPCCPSLPKISSFTGKVKTETINGSSSRQESG